MYYSKVERQSAEWHIPSHKRLLAFEQNAAKLALLHCMANVQLPYGPDLAMVDFFISEGQVTLKRCRFDGIEAIQKSL